MTTDFYKTRVTFCDKKQFSKLMIPKSEEFHKLYVSLVLFITYRHEKRIKIFIIYTVIWEGKACFSESCCNLIKNNVPTYFTHFITLPIHNLFMTKLTRK